jgi:hypothetical protein
MRKLVLSIFTLILFLTSFAAPKAYKLLRSTTNWASPANWSPFGLPQNGDTIRIPESIQLTLSNDFTFSNLYLDVFGGLIISGNNMKMDLSENSTINVHSTGWIDGDKASQQIVLNSIIYKGDYPVLTGPKIATQSSSGFVPYKEFTVLPVQFIAFTATGNSSNTILQWTTADEKGAAYYEVQRSTNGTSWTGIATLQPNFNTINQYSYTDKSSTSNTSYYRIKQVDADGTVTFSVIRMRKNSTDAPSITAYEHTISVAFPKQHKGTAIIEVIGLNGNSIAKQQVANPSGIVHLAVSGLQGLYLVRVSNGQDLNTAKQVRL